MGKRLYVGNLPYSVTDEALAAKFGQHGAVESARVIIDRDSGKHKGFGYVEMRSESDAQAAVAALNGADYEGRLLRVKETRPPTQLSGARHAGSLPQRED